MSEEKDPIVSKFVERGYIHIKPTYKFGKSFLSHDGVRYYLRWEREVQDCHKYDIKETYNCFMVVNPSHNAHHHLYCHSLDEIPRIEGEMSILYEKLNYKLLDNFLI